MLPLKEKMLNNKNFVSLLGYPPQPASLGFPISRTFFCIAAAKDSAPPLANIIPSSVYSHSGTVVANIFIGAFSGFDFTGESTKDEYLMAYVPLQRIGVQEAPVISDCPVLRFIITLHRRRTAASELQHPAIY